MFDIDLHRKWIDALRSGNYKQGREALRTDDDEFCCLGVAADQVEGIKWQDGVGDRCCIAVFPNGNIATALLPQPYGDLLGLEVADLDKYCSVIQWVLADMNDAGWSFSEIADAIEVMIP